VNLGLTVGAPGPAGLLRQLTLGLSARGLSFGYQRDVFDPGGRGHTYRIGYAAGRAGLAVGFATALYRGGTSSSGWDLGILYDWRPSLSLGGVIENVGRPSVRGTTLPVTYVPSATLRLFEARAAVSADGRFTSGSVLGYAFGLRASLGATTRAPVGLLARLNTDGALRRAGLAFGVSLGSQDLAGLVAAAPGGRQRGDQGLARLVRRLVTVGGILGEHPLDHAGEGRRHVAAQLADRHRVDRRLLHEHRLGRFALERRRAGEHLVQHHAEGV